MPSEPPYDPSRFLDYGQGKTRNEEAYDSTVMLAWVMIFALVVSVIVGVVLYVWVF